MTASLLFSLLLAVPSPSRAACVVAGLSYLGLPSLPALLSTKARDLSACTGEPGR